jgi:hypothetical protein
MITKDILKYMLTLGLAASIALQGCKDNLPLPDQPIDSYTKVYMPQAVNAPGTRTVKITDEVQALTYGANYGGYSFAPEDIPVTFKVDKDAVSTYNTANRTNYSILPEGSYTLSAFETKIPKGGVATPPLSVLLKTKGPGAIPALQDFILPVSIAHTSVKVNEALRTTYFIVRSQPDLADYPYYDRSTWTILNFSSQEANGEGANNGRALFALDGKNDTFWHTQWQGASPGPPHSLTIDIGSIKVFHGVALLARQADGGGKPNEVNVEISEDNITWVNAGIVNMANNKNLQPVFFKDGFGINFRYFRLIINSSYGGNYTQVAELNVF